MQGEYGFMHTLFQVGAGFKNKIRTELLPFRIIVAIINIMSIVIIIINNNFVQKLITLFKSANLRFETNSLRSKI